MTEPTTVNKALIIPNTGDLAGTWGSSALNPDFAAIDGMLGGVTAISVSSTNIVLTAPTGSITPSAGPNQSQNAVLRFTGALTADVAVGMPLPGFYIIENLTTSTTERVLQFYATTPGGGEAVSTPPGSRMHVFSDGTNVRFVNQIGAPPGSMLFMGGVSVQPRWIGACTVRPYLFADGIVYSISSYPALGALYGNKFGGDGTTTFATPDMSGRVPLMYDFTGTRITVSGCGINGQSVGASGGEQAHILSIPEIPSHGHVVVDPGHVHSYNQYNTVGRAGSESPAQSPTAGSAQNTAPAATGITLQNTGGTGAHNNVPPALVAGIWLIKT